MKKIISLKTICLMLVALLALGSLAACSSGGSGSGGSSAPATTEASGYAISARLPDGWILRAGKDIETVGYVDDADYIIKAADVDTSAPTLQVALAYQSSDDIDSWKGWIDGGSFGDPNEPFEANGVTWYTAKEGGVALIDGKVCLVYNINGADFSEPDIQTILGSISWLN